MSQIIALNKKETAPLATRDLFVEMLQLINSYDQDFPDQNIFASSFIFWINQPASIKIEVDQYYDKPESVHVSVQYDDGKDHAQNWINLLKTLETRLNGAIVAMQLRPRK